MSFGNQGSPTAANDYTLTKLPGGPLHAVGTATPESALAAPVGSLFHDITNGELYVKNTGTGNTGWKVVTHA